MKTIAKFFISPWGFLVAIMASRLVPHPPNFSAVGAVCLMAGLVAIGRKAKWQALAFPMLALVGSDFVLGFHGIAPFVYIGFLMQIILGLLFTHKYHDLKSPVLPNILAMIGVVLFFVVSNVGVWLMTGMYPLTMSGLLFCFVAALPFLVNQLLAQLLFTNLFHRFVQLSPRNVQKKYSRIRLTLG